MKKRLGVKKLLVLMVVFLAFFLLVEGPALAAESLERAPSVVIDGESILFDVPPRIQNNRVLVPLRGIFEKIGAQVDWDQSTGTITILSAGKRIELRINSITVIINDELRNIDISPFLINSRTMVPLRFVSENLGATVVWESASHQVKITASKGEISGGINSLLVSPGSNAGGSNKPNHGSGSSGKQNGGSGSTEQDKSNRFNTPDNNGGSIEKDNGIGTEDNNHGSEEPDVNDEDPDPKINTSVKLAVQSSTVKTGETFEVKVYVSDVKDLYTMEVQLAFSPALLKVTNIKGEFMGGSDIIKAVDKNAGTIDHVSTKLGQVPGKSVTV